MCPNCASDIHSCKNCVHYDEKLSSKCNEPNSPWIRDRESQNNCDFFEFKQDSGEVGADDTQREAEQAKVSYVHWITLSMLKEQESK